MPKLLPKPFIIASANAALLIVEPSVTFISDKKLLMIPKFVVDTIML